MILGGDDIEEGIKNWIKEEIKSGPTREYDLGKFLFSVSSGTTGLLFLAEKLGGSSSWSNSLILSFIILTCTSALSLFMVVPKKWEIMEDDDLQDVRNNIIKRTVHSAWWWFGLWCLGLGVGISAVIN